LNLKLSEKVHKKHSRER